MILKSFIEILSFYDLLSKKEGLFSKTKDYFWNLAAWMLLLFKLFKFLNNNWYLKKMPSAIKHNFSYKQVVFQEI